MVAATNHGQDKKCEQYQERKHDQAADQDLRFHGHNLLQALERDVVVVIYTTAAIEIAIQGD